jgi:hypothetical protein
MPSLAGRTATAEGMEASPLDGLLQQQVGTQPLAVTPAPGQVLLGRVLTLPNGAQPGQVEVDGLGTLSLAHSLVPLLTEHMGQRVALSLMASQHGPQQALLLGLLWDGSSEQQTSAEIDHAQDEGLVITVDGHREVIEAAQELELRCGEACIVLTADGRIQLRGTYITSHASATQRIVGGSVHVN